MMKSHLRSLLFSALAIISASALSSIGKYRPLITRRDAAADLIATLQNSNDLKEFAGLLQGQGAVISQIFASPGPKTLLAPTNAAIKDLSRDGIDTAGHPVEDVQATLLYHVLNGTFDMGRVAEAPLHTIGHSLLTLHKLVTLPGGNGQAVAMASGEGSRSEKRAASDPEIEVIQDDTNIAISEPRETLQSGDITIQPVEGLLTIPKNATETMRRVDAEAWLDYLVYTPQIVEREVGVTLFVPTDDAIDQFNKTHADANVTHEDMHDLVMNHIVDRRVLYSPLLSQGSIISAAGNDVVFDAKQGTVQIGASKAAKILRYDIIHRGGVIHLIDAVLDVTQADYARANRAAKSAGLAGNSYIAGPVSLQNCASTQGKYVPPSPADSLSPAQNSSLDTFDVTDSGQFRSSVLGSTGVGILPVGGASRDEQRYVGPAQLGDPLTSSLTSSSTCRKATSKTLALMLLTILLLL